MSGDPEQCGNETTQDGLPYALPVQFPVPTGFQRIGPFITSFKFWNRFETNYVTGVSGPSMRFNCVEMKQLNMLAGFEFKIGPRRGTIGDDTIGIKFPRCNIIGGQRGGYMAQIKWFTTGANSEGRVGSEWPHPTTAQHDFNTDDPNPQIGDIKDGEWHAFLAACYNDSQDNVVIKVWYNAVATGYFQDYIYLGSSIDNGSSKTIPPAPKLAFSSLGHSGGTHPLQIRIDEIPSNDTGGGAYTFPSANFDIRNMFTCEISQGSPPAMVPSNVTCGPGRYFDPIQGVCILNPRSAGTTSGGIILPPLPTTNYSIEDINYSWVADHKANGSFREEWDRTQFATKADLNSVIVGGYVKTKGITSEIQVKVGGGRHSPSDGGRAGRCYVIRITSDGTRVRLTKENPSGTEWLTPHEYTLNLGSRSGRYTGIIVMKVNVIHNGNECVRIIAFIDTEGMSNTGTFTASKQDWVRILDIIDTGQMAEGKGRGAWLTNAIPGDSKVMIRTDGQIAATYNFLLGFCARIRGGPAY